MASTEARDRISISFCISDNYVQHMAVVVASILAHNPGARFVFHVVHRFISEANCRQLKAWEEQSAGRFSFVLHQVDARRFDAFPLPLEHITQEMYYRYLLPELLADEKRTLYMDVDVLVLGDITPLWELDLRGNAVAATEDIKEHTPEFKTYLQRLGMSPDAPYFYSGMLVMDLVVLRAMDFGARCMRNTAEHIHHIAWPDQDVINLTLEGQILPLPLRFNCTAPKLLPRGERVVIRHFANFSSKPWCCLWKNRTWLAYTKYLLKTPWRKNVLAFILAHVRGFFWFTYTKKGITRTLCCGVLIRKRKIVKEEEKHHA